MPRATLTLKSKATRTKQGRFLAGPSIFRLEILSAVCGTPVLDVDVFLDADIYFFDVRSMIEVLVHRSLIKLIDRHRVAKNSSDQCLLMTLRKFQAWNRSRARRFLLLLIDARQPVNAF